MLRTKACALKIVAGGPPESVRAPYSTALSFLCVQFSSRRGSNLHFSRWPHSPVSPGYFCLDCFHCSSANFLTPLTICHSLPPSLGRLPHEWWVFSPVLAEVVSELQPVWSVSKSRPCHAAWTSKPLSISGCSQDKNTSWAWPSRALVICSLPPSSCHARALLATLQLHHQRFGAVLASYPVRCSCRPSLSAWALVSLTVPIKSPSPSRPSFVMLSAVVLFLPIFFKTNLLKVSFIIAEI